MPVFFLFACQTKPKQPTEKYFEGKITYINEYESYHPGRTEEFYRAQFGDTVQIYYKEGFYKQVYNCSDSLGIKQLIYNSETNQVYLQLNNSDSLKQFTATEDANKKLLTSNNKKAADTILGKVCYALNFESEFDAQTKINIQNTYYYSNENLRIKEEDMKFHTMSYLNRLSKKGYFYLGYKYTDYETYQRFQKAIKIEPKEISFELFEVDTSLIKSN